ncbi:MAG: hypothetical protein EBZ36_09470 [Acidobacteria bacterium]|nr:hypothetical protein [Acidobacteriota bacterium]
MLVGIGALATLSLVDWARRGHFINGEVTAFLIGVMPNVAAAIAIPFVILGIRVEQRKELSSAAVRWSFAVLSLVAGVGLILWEVLQQASRALVFDPNDIGATLIGLLLGWVVFNRLTPKFPPAVG